MSDFKFDDADAASSKPKKRKRRDDRNYYRDDGGDEREDRRRPRRKTNPKAVPIIAGIVGLLVVSAILVAPAMRNAKQNTPTPIVLSAQELCKAYSDNEVAANNKFRDRLIEATGDVLEIREGHIEISPGPTNHRIELKAELKNRADAANLKRGMSVTIRGKCYGRGIGGDVVLEDCTIAKIN